MTATEALEPTPTANEAAFWNNRTVREVETESIRKFVESVSHLLTGRVLDFGAGKPGTCRTPQPYRDLISGEYVPYDQGDPAPAGQFDCILCTQVIQQIREPHTLIRYFADLLKPGGRLVMTYPTTWPEIDPAELWRFTKQGMQMLLRAASFRVDLHVKRAELNLDGVLLPLGYGCVSRKAGQHTSMGPDESAALLTKRLLDKEPFFFLRYGDGALECINNLGRGLTCDGERYSEDLGIALKQAWDKVISAPKVFIGDWLSASFFGNKKTEYPAEYMDLIGDAKPSWLHFEALLLRVNSTAIIDFYKTLAADPRKKVLLGPAEHAESAKMLNAQHVETPMSDLFALNGKLTERILATDFEILMFGAGMAGAIAVINSWERFPERTYIHLGSALDPLFRGRTRKDQISTGQARRILHELL